MFALFSRGKRLWDFRAFADYSEAVNAAVVVEHALGFFVDVVRVIK